MADHVKLLGVTLDNRLSMDKHVNEVNRTCFYHLRALRHTRPVITASDANMIACSVVGSRLDCSNAVFYGVLSENVNRLQRIQYAGSMHRTKFIVVRTCWYINYTGCLSIIVFTSNLQSSRSLLAHLPPVRTSTHQLPDLCHPMHFTLKILACSLFPGQRQSLVRERFASLRRPFLILFLGTLDRLTMFCRLTKMFYFCNTFDQH